MAVNSRLLLIALVGVASVAREGSAREPDYLGWLEKTEGLKTVGYIPTPGSGVTIAVGIDLGQQSESNLKKLGVSDSILDKLKPYLGLTTKARVAAAKKDPSKLELTREEALELTKLFLTKNVEIAELYGKNMSPAGKEVLVSLRHWAGSLGPLKVVEKLQTPKGNFVWEAIKGYTATDADLKGALESTLATFPNSKEARFNRIAKEIDHLSFEDEAGSSAGSSLPSGQSAAGLPWPEVPIQPIGLPLPEVPVPLIGLPGMPNPALPIPGMPNPILPLVPGEGIETPKQCNKSALGAYAKKKEEVKFVTSAKNCDFYDQFQKQFCYCDPKVSYAISFGKKFCNEYLIARPIFRNVAWQDAVRKCLQDNLASFANSSRDWPTCDQIHDAAFKSHPTCYDKPDPSRPELSFSKLPLADMGKVLCVASDAGLGAIAKGIEAEIVYESDKFVKSVKGLIKLIAQAL